MDSIRMTDMTDEQRATPSGEEDVVGEGSIPRDDSTTDGLESGRSAEAAAHDDAEGEPDGVEALEQELERTRAAYARAMADYQNLQRRSREERAELHRLTTKALVLNYLPVLDDFNRALDSAGDHPELLDHPWVEGVRMVQRKFQGVLEGAGVRPIEAAYGVPFDPQLHEAVAHQPGPLNEVIGVVQGGYVIDETVVRPAMVIVGNGEPSPQGGDAGN